MAERDRRGAERVASGRVDAGRVLLGGYALFVVAAGARSAVQLATHAGRAPLAYALSAVAAGVYLVGFALLVRRSSFAQRWCMLEFAGVLVVGSLSLVRSDWFPDATVWSRFGEGYGFVPLVLPLLALAWLRRPSGRVLIDRSGSSP
ncbi:MAG TPA: hypothetical protein VGL21_16780 [Jatrophihabitantaceae bacterium]